MDINTLMDAVSAALAADEDLASWADDNYAATLKVFVSRDLQDPPAEADMPCLIVYPISKRVGRFETSKEHGVLVEAWLKDASVRDRDGYANIVEYTGSANIEALRKLAETAVAGVDTGNVIMATVEVEYDTVSMFPLFFAIMALTFIDESVPMGADRLE